jgi:hypothetical protein
MSKTRKVLDMLDTAVQWITMSGKFADLSVPVFKEGDLLHARDGRSLIIIDVLSRHPHQPSHAYTVLALDGMHYVVSEAVLRDWHRDI